MGDEFIVESMLEVTLYQRILQKKCLISIFRLKFPFVGSELACLLLLPMLGPDHQPAADHKEALLQA